ncbi:MAG TPA: SAM-dependent methyltransferase [Egibacteraceae bacterium]|nr:SAM-dependent methyltransferase [Egibacteraceae bacterium]
MAWLPWRTAMAEALYGPNGFYRRSEGPAGHFRTSVHASPWFAVAVAGLARAAGLDAVVDVGAGRGELVRGLRWADPDLRLHAVELADPPADLPADVSWSDTLGSYDGALLFANEWLDAVPIDVVEQTADGPRLVEVETTTGEERLGDHPAPEDLAWLRQWWPLDAAEAGDRAEVGRPRDDAWASAITSLQRGVAVAADYAHIAGARPSLETLCGYREGRLVRPVPDGSCDLTAHVAIDACAVAGEAAGASATLLTRQRTALRALGVRGQRPPLELARTDPPAYLRGLQAAGQQAELTDGAGLGRFYWLVQAVGMPVPPVLAEAEAEVSAPVDAKGG